MTRAIRVHEFGDPEVMKEADVDLLKEADIDLLEADEVLVEVKAFGVNPSDTYIRSGNYSKPQLPNLPYTPGKDAAGVVLDSKSNKFQPGDRVYTTKTRTGAYGRHLITSAKNHGVHKVCLYF